MLQTFYDVKKMNREVIKYMFDTCNDFLLDSGAFSFMNSGVRVDLAAYIEQYINFINKHNIEKYFELDLYTVENIGIENTLKIREYIETNTGKKSIPVFHACMGMKMFRELCEKYDYIGIGSSAVTKECRWVRNKNVLKQVVKIANSYGTKVHGLGYTRRENINKTEIPFYSVDSISWTLNTGFGYEYYVKHGNILRMHPKGRNEKDKESLTDKNVKAWCKIQKIKENE